MEYNSLLDRIKEKDRDAFMELMRLYGKGVYSRLLSQLSTREMADAAFKETMVGFYNALSGSGGGDAVEALLYSYADAAGRQQLESSLDRVINETMDEAGAEETAEPEKETGDEDAEPAAEEKEDTKDEAAEEDDAEALEETGEEEGSGYGAGKRGAALGFGIGALSLAILAVLWVIAGLLMDMDILPAVDLGYSWFTMNVAPWF